MQNKNPSITSLKLGGSPPSSNYMDSSIRPAGSQSALLLLLREGPPWLEAFLNARYFDPCRYHLFSKNEKNHFCIDCHLTVKGPLCCRGLHSDHASHRTLQIRRASHADGIRVDDISKLLDISGIQTYIINNHRIVFLLRQLNKPVNHNAGSNTTNNSMSLAMMMMTTSTTNGNGHGSSMLMSSNVSNNNYMSSRHCLACGRALSTDPMKFCSIKCKLVVIRQQSFASGFSHFSLMPPSNLVNAAASLASSSSSSSLVADNEYCWRAAGPGPDRYDGGAAQQYLTHLKRKFDLSLMPAAENDAGGGAPAKSDPSLLSPISVLRPPSSSGSKHEPIFGGMKPAACEAAAAVDTMRVSSRGAAVVVRPGPVFLYENGHGLAAPDQRMEVALVNRMLGGGNCRRKRRRKGMPHRAPLF